MTQPHPQHCDHECVCMGMPNFYEEDEPCTKDKCKHDTRTPAAPAPEPSIESVKGMEQKSGTKSPDDRYHLCRSDASRHACINLSGKELLCDECNIIELEERLMNLEQELKDARKAEREQVLDALDEWLNSDDCLTLYKWQVRESMSDKVVYDCKECLYPCKLSTRIGHTEPTICPMGVGSRYPNVANWRKRDAP